MKENARVPDLRKLQSQPATSGATYSIYVAKGRLINDEAKGDVGRAVSAD